MNRACNHITIIMILQEARLTIVYNVLIYS